MGTYWDSGDDSMISGLGTSSAALPYSNATTLAAGGTLQRLDAATLQAAFTGLLQAIASALVANGSTIAGSAYTGASQLDTSSYQAALIGGGTGAVAGADAHAHGASGAGAMAHAHGGAGGAAMPGHEGHGHDSMMYQIADTPGNPGNFITGSTGATAGEDFKLEKGAGFKGKEGRDPNNADQEQNNLTKADANRMAYGIPKTVAGTGEKPNYVQDIQVGIGMGGLEALRPDVMQVLIDQQNAGKGSVWNGVAYLTGLNDQHDGSVPPQLEALRGEIMNTQVGGSGKTLAQWAENPKDSQGQDWARTNHAQTGIKAYLQLEAAGATPAQANEYANNDDMVSGAGRIDQIAPGRASNNQENTFTGMNNDERKEWAKIDNPAFLRIMMDSHTMGSHMNTQLGNQGAESKINGSLNIDPNMDANSRKALLVNYFAANKTDPEVPGNENDGGNENAGNETKTVDKTVDKDAAVQAQAALPTSITTGSDGVTINGINGGENGERAAQTLVSVDSLRGSDTRQTAFSNATNLVDTSKRDSLAAALGGTRARQLMDLLQSALQNDGTIDPSELDAFLKKATATQADVITEALADGDITPEERQAIEDAARGNTQADRTALRAKLDQASGDSHVDVAERAEILAGVDDEAKPVVTELLKNNLTPERREAITKLLAGTPAERAAAVELLIDGANADEDVTDSETAGILAEVKDEGIRAKLQERLRNAVTDAEKSAIADLAKGEAGTEQAKSSADALVDVAGGDKPADGDAKPAASDKPAGDVKPEGGDKPAGDAK
jgi:hypothetical protein